jgi:enoyl-CoA hydratase/carnithine racemase
MFWRGLIKSFRRWKMKEVSVVIITGAGQTFVAGPT